MKFFQTSENESQLALSGQIATATELVKAPESFHNLLNLIFKLLKTQIIFLVTRQESIYMLAVYFANN